VFTFAVISKKVGSKNNYLFVQIHFFIKISKQAL
jgi:hypothetical protein